jgi:iron-sulfur cluster insertion protein
MNTPVKILSAETPQIYLTDNAAKKLNQLFLAEEKENLKLRIFIEGGGCSGFKYEFAFETSIGEDDQVFKKTVDDINDNYQILIILAICAHKDFLKTSIFFLNCCFVLNSKLNYFEVEVIIDSMSFLYLQNSEVDYEENFQDSRFIIRNPNAKSSCGCGSSFSA